MCTTTIRALRPREKNSDISSDISTVGYYEKMRPKSVGNERPREINRNIKCALPQTGAEGKTEEKEYSNFSTSSIIRRQLGRLH